MHPTLLPNKQQATMKKLYTAAQTRELDRLAIQEHGIPGYTLMTRAGEACFAFITQHWRYAKSMCVLCGSGNNGGDGYIIARLALMAGWQVQVYAMNAPEALKNDALQAYKDFIQCGGKITIFRHELPKTDLYVDALLGTGLDRPVTGNYATAIQQLNTQSGLVVSVDIPSGLNADTGSIMGQVVKATATVTFIARKIGLFTGQAKEYVGELVFEDLNIPATVYQQLIYKQHSNQNTVRLLDKTIISHHLPKRKQTAHKGHFGHSLLVGGAPGMSGAIRLAGEAALRTGSGLVTVATHPQHAAYVNLTRPELMVAASESPVHFRQTLAKATAIGIGPGLGQESWSRNLLSQVLNSNTTKVLDADALNLLAQSRSKRDDWILTPHPGEAAHLLACSVTEIETDRIQAATTLQKDYGGVIVLKGAGTVIASQTHSSLCPVGNPGMASGGMGDVLTGIITALLAQGLSLVDAAETGVYIHAYAADEAARQGGERGLIASDVVVAIRKVINI
jgi:hydroxyethylthiazole kinase-like uncharacterized protein yjeF